VAEYLAADLADEATKNGEAELIDFAVNMSCGNQMLFKSDLEYYSFSCLTTIFLLDNVHLLNLENKRG